MQRIVRLELHELTYCRARCVPTRPSSASAANSCRGEAGAGRERHRRHGRRRRAITAPPQTAWQPPSPVGVTRSGPSSCDADAVAQQICLLESTALHYDLVSVTHDGTWFRAMARGERECAPPHWPRSRGNPDLGVRPAIGFMTRSRCRLSATAAGVAPVTQRSTAHCAAERRAVGAGTGRIDRAPALRAPRARRPPPLTAYVRLRPSRCGRRPASARRMASGLTGRRPTARRPFPAEADRASGRLTNALSAPCTDATGWKTAAEGRWCSVRYLAILSIRPLIRTTRSSAATTRAGGDCSRARCGWWRVGWSQGTYRDRDGSSIAQAIPCPPSCEDGQRLAARNPMLPSSPSRTTHRSR
jgi:hypothetical protein